MDRLKCYNFFMKILCDKCSKDITSTIYQEIEKNTPKHIVCPHCHKEQKRYLSSVDYQIYLLFIEAGFFLLSFLTTLLMDAIGFNLIFGVIFIVILALAIYVTNSFKYKLYTNSFFKKETMYIKIDEDEKAVAKSIRWQFVLFFVLVITFVTEMTNSLIFWSFVGLSIMAILLSALKTALMIKKEKQTYSNKKGTN